MTTSTNPKSRFSTIVKSLIVTVTILFAVNSRGICADTTNVVLAKNTFYIQLAGQGNKQSINFKHIFLQGKTFNYSYSVGYAPAGADFSIPLSLNATTKGKAHHIEGSLGIISHIEHHTYSKKIDSDKQLFIAPGIAYSYQKNTGGLFLKVGVAPQILLDPPSYNLFACSVNFIKPSANLSLGFSF